MKVVTRHIVTFHSLEDCHVIAFIVIGFKNHFQCIFFASPFSVDIKFKWHFFKRMEVQQQSGDCHCNLVSYRILEISCCKSFLSFLQFFSIFAVFFIFMCLRERKFEIEKKWLTCKE